MLSFTYYRSLILLFLLFFLSCNEIFEYSPYDVDIKSRNQNTIFIEHLSNRPSQVNDTISFALLSDPHFYYDELANAVSSINTHNNLAFVLVCGDVTESGLTREYSFYHNHIKKIKYPCFTLIGNHDYLSNGEKAYQRMFGPTNFSFQYGAYNFIAFDNIVWEKGNICPNFEWLNSQIKTSDKKCVIFTHIPPWTDQFNEEYRNLYYSIVNNPAVAINIHGHQHHYMDTIINDKRYFVTEAVFEREYYIVKMMGEAIDIETIKF
jgi:predicted phosphodiesterase